MDEVVEFEGCLQGSGCFKIDSDKAVVMKIMIPASEIQAVTQMTKYFTECPLKFRVERG